MFVEYIQKCVILRFTANNANFKKEEHCKTGLLLKTSETQLHLNFPGSY